jgi:glycine/D-amino acid oxidase-like deaminating enzyme
MSAPTSVHRGALDAIIVGVGIAGLWLTSLLTKRGYRVAAFESGSIGCGQTLASQGMIHGGLKYALSGRLTRASEAIAGMPPRWRRCLAGHDDVDLSGLTPLSEHYYLFADAGSLGRLTGFFASKLLRGRISRVAPHEFPHAFRRFDGVLYRLNDFVLDTAAVLARLRRGLDDRLLQLDIRPDMLHRHDDGWRLEIGDAQIDARRLILAAGAGNGPLLEGLGIREPAMQLRPLHQVIVRDPQLEPVFAHCLTGIARAEPRITITSHPDPRAEGRWLWYLGGQLATDGVGRDADQQVAHARAELTRCVPWFDWSDAELTAFRIDRAEPAQEGGERPDEAFVAATDGCVVGWPTKLSLVPDLGDRVLSELPPPLPGEGFPPLGLPTATMGTPPWQR